MPSKSEPRSWVIVTASLIALCVGSTPVAFFSQGVFLPAMTQDLGWSRGEYFVGGALGAIACALCAPAFGWFGDRWGLRRTLLWGITIYGVANALLAALTGSAWQYYAISIFAGAMAFFQSPPLYVKAISAVTTRNRGLAIGIALTGTGIGTAILMPLLSIGIETIGWRWSRVGLSAVMLAVALPVVYFFIREPKRQEGTQATVAQGGYDGAPALKTLTFWLLAAIFFLSALAINGVVANIVPILHDRSFSLAIAASVVSGLAIAQIVGRVGAGALLDYANSPKIGLLWFAVAIVGILIIGNADTLGWAITGAMLIGLSLGAELELSGYFISRFFGLKSFGRLYGTLFCFFTLGTAFGPAIVGYIYGLNSTYQPAILLAAGALVVCCALLMFLGPYTYARTSSSTAGNRANESIEPAQNSQSA